MIYHMMCEAADVT